MKKFLKTEAIKFGWAKMKENFWFFVGLSLIVGVIAIVSSGLNAFLEKRSPLLYFLVSIIFWVILSIISLGMIKISLKFCEEGGRAKYSDLFTQYPLFFKYLAGSILYGLIVLGGYILLIIPGIIWGIKFQFYPYFIVDKGMGPIEALKKSSAITKGAKWDLFLFSLLACLINLLGVLCLIIGLFATAPTIMVAYAFVYRKLLAQIEASQTSQNV